MYGWMEPHRMMTRNRFIAALASIALLAAAQALAAAAWIEPPELLDKIKPGMKEQEVEKILGRPVNRSSFPRLGVTSMDYMMVELGESYDIGIMIDANGVVKEVQKIRRYRGGGP
jgi:hypothetical protein